MRIIQGAGGGALQPIAQAILLENFPKEKHGQAMGVYGLGVVVAPIIGPVLGGWITDNYSWRWIFFINVPVGIIAMMLMQQFINDPPWMRGRAGAEAGRARIRLHVALARLPGGAARQGPGGRLVRLALHHPDGGPRGHRPARLCGPGAHRRAALRGPAGDEDLQLQRRPGPDVLRRRDPLRHDGRHPPLPARADGVHLPAERPRHDPSGPGRADRHAARRSPGQPGCRAAIWSPAAS